MTAVPKELKRQMVLDFLNDIPFLPFVTVATLKIIPNRVLLCPLVASQFSDIII